MFRRLILGATTAQAANDETFDPVSREARRFADYGGVTARVRTRRAAATHADPAPDDRSESRA
jgi:hypothetical protein